MYLCDNTVVIQAKCGQGLQKSSGWPKGKESPLRSYGSFWSCILALSILHSQDMSYLASSQSHAPCPQPQEGMKSLMTPTAQCHHSQCQTVNQSKPFPFLNIYISQMLGLKTAATTQQTFYVAFVNIFCHSSGKCNTTSRGIWR